MIKKRFHSRIEKPFKVINKPSIHGFKSHLISHFIFIRNEIEYKAEILLRIYI